MMMCEEYNGWPNRETWALNLWISNDQGLYNMFRDAVSEAISGYAEEDDYPSWVDTEDEAACDRFLASKAGEAMKGDWEELTDPDEQLMTADKILEMTRDIGSEYRVDWDAIGAAWLEDAS